MDKYFSRGHNVEIGEMRIAAAPPWAPQTAFYDCRRAYAALAGALHEDMSSRDRHKDFGSLGDTGSN